MTDKFGEVFLDLIKAHYDGTPTENENYAKQLITVHQEFVKRNKALTGLLEDYINQRNKRNKENTRLKEFIFWLFFIMLIALTIVVIYVFWNADINKSNISSTISLLSVAATYLTSILSIIKIISKYLFPYDEEKDTIEMIKTVIQNDVQVEDIMSNAIDKTNEINIDKLIKCKELFDSKALTQEEFDKLKSSIINV